MQTQTTEKSVFYQMGAALAETVFAPDYYDGAWFVRLDEQRKRRLCRNYITAKAWAAYLRRNGYRFITLQKAL